MSYLSKNFRLFYVPNLSVLKHSSFFCSCMRGHSSNFPRIYFRFRLQRWFLLSETRNLPCFYESIPGEAASDEIPRITDPGRTEMLNKMLCTYSSTRLSLHSKQLECWRSINNIAFKLVVYIYTPFEVWQWLSRFHRVCCCS